MCQETMNQDEAAQTSPAPGGGRQRPGFREVDVYGAELDVASWGATYDKPHMLDPPLTRQAPGTPGLEPQLLAKIALAASDPEDSGNLTSATAPSQAPSFGLAGQNEPRRNVVRGGTLLYRGSDRPTAGQRRLSGAPSGGHGHDIGRDTSSASGLGREGGGRGGRGHARRETAAAAGEAAWAQYFSRCDADAEAALALQGQVDAAEWAEACDELTTPTEVDVKYDKLWYRATILRKCYFAGDARPQTVSQSEWNDAADSATEKHTEIWRDHQAGMLRVRYKCFSFKASETSPSVDEWIPAGSSRFAPAGFYTYGVSSR